MATTVRKESGSATYEDRKSNHHFGRYRQIALVLIKYRLRELVRTLGLERFMPLHWVPPGLPWQKQIYSKPERTRMAIEELGTTFVKLGQILSTRNDVIPPEYVHELAKLQNSLRPLSVEMIKTVIHKELGKPVEELFSSFEPDPVGVASIGQVHAAVLRDGTEVVVKTRKPGVVEQVDEDVDILRQMALVAARRWKGPQHYDLVGIIEEVAEALTGEMDYVKEGHNAEYFARFFASDRTVHVPKVFWEYTTVRVITMERIRGIGILDLASLEKAGFNRQELGRRSVNLWLKMVFEGDVFHADPHPGNLFVEPDGRLGLIDFGMVGTVDDEVRENLSLAIKAILDRDVDLLVDALIELGAIRREVSRDDLRADLKHIMTHYPKQVGLAELQGSSNLGELFSVVRRHRVQLPSNTFLLLKAMAMAQSLGKALDPGLDVITLVKPNVIQIYRKSHSPLAVARGLPSMITEMANLGIGLPQRLNRLMRSLERGEIQVQTDVSGLEVHMEHLERIVNRIVIGVVAAAVILGVTIVLLALRMG
jgi:ubiquinone biosynthesis protein